MVISAGPNTKSCGARSVINLSIPRRSSNSIKTRLKGGTFFSAISTFRTSPYQSSGFRSSPYQSSGFHYPASTPFF